MKLFGTTAYLTDVAKLIMKEDVGALENLVHQGLDINEKMKITETLIETPINLVLCENKYKVLEWLLSKGVELNDKDSPSILMASSNCEPKTVKLLIEKGANVNAKHRIGKTAMSEALYANNYENISLLLKSGYEIDKDGQSLRQAVATKQMQAIGIFITNGVDVNFCKPNMVYPNNPTPVHLASNYNDLNTFKFLVEHGADITIKDKYGERPYNCAVKNKNKEMIELIKSLEPEGWHNEKQKLLDFKKYQIPTELVALLKNENRRLAFPKNKNVKYIIFNSILELNEVSWNHRKFIDLLNEVDMYCNKGFLVWYPQKKCFAFADYEHEEFKELCSIKEFLMNPEKQIDKIFE
ncbi:ankyrin repeat domain-containing protein [Aquimarina algiphila]|uniref:ankyrin repeat domain-containing protein n=1 Tax=Aquimarina algiphila TaxID=2047982 RepID=UPI002330CEB8|nr:ankyrin repeat domain-containing protein [Aquimarina algiphila]